MSEPLVSIIIPCWNSEEFVGSAIESALGQDYPNVEVIVIDDGSTDGSLQVIRAFGDRIVWRSEPNRGAPLARNRGLEVARGELIQFLDSDDLLAPDKLSIQVPIVEGNPDKIVYCSRKVVDYPESETIVALPARDDPVVQCLEDIIHTAAPIYRKETLVAAGGYRPDLRCCQDYELHLRLATSGWRFHHIDTVLYTVRRQPTSISSNNLKVFRQMVTLWDEVVPELIRAGQLDDRRRAALARLYATRGRWFIRESANADAEHCFEAADRLDRKAARLAYGPATLTLRNILGPARAEKVSQLGRRLRQLR